MEHFYLLLIVQCCEQERMTVLREAILTRTEALRKPSWRLKIQMYLQKKHKCHLEVEQQGGPCSPNHLLLQMHIKGIQVHQVLS